LTQIYYNKSFIVLLFLASCLKTPANQDSSQITGGSPHGKDRAAEDKKSEKNFREIFAAFLAETGASQKDIDQAIFYTPDQLLLPPTKTGIGKDANLKIIDEHFRPHTPESAYALGQCIPPQPRELKSGKGPVTIIVFPGFTSEFIAVDPFEEVLANQGSLFAKKMVPILANLSDSVYQVRDQKHHTVKMSEVVRVASYDRKGVPWVNLMVLTPKLGSLESLGSIRPLTEIYARRLHKILHNARGVDSLGQIYLLGFSRGAAVGLDFLTHINEQGSQKYPWSKRIRGLVSLGGALYGSQAPDRAISGDNSDDSKTVIILRNFISEIMIEPPSDLTSQAYAKEATVRIGKNMATWSRLIAEMNAIGRDPSQKSTFSKLLAEEEALRHTADIPEKAGIISNFETLKNVLFGLLSMKCSIQCHFQNVKASKQILQSFIDGVDELTTQKRLAWWDEHKLPAHIRLLSIAATMPGPPVNRQLSTLLASPYIGYRSPDFVSRLRPGYYASLETGAGFLNDSAIGVARARYWPQLDSVTGRRHDYLGILGAHHYGIAFPYAVADKNSTPNPFPRSLLLAAIGSYIREYPHEPKP
jgi:hypothetical protein